MRIIRSLFRVTVPVMAPVVPLPKFRTLLVPFTMKLLATVTPELTDTPPLLPSVTATAVGKPVLLFISRRPPSCMVRVPVNAEAALATLRTKTPVFAPLVPSEPLPVTVNAPEPVKRLAALSR